MDVMRDLCASGLTVDQQLLLHECIILAKDTQRVKKSEEKKRYVYLASAKASPLVKIGVSQNPWSRVIELRNASPEPIDLICTFKCEEAVNEFELHRMLESLRHNGEWFNISADLMAFFIEASTEKSSYEDVLRSLRSQLRNYVSEQKESPPHPQKKNNIYTPSEAKASVSPKAKRGSRLPDDWHPSENLWQLAKRKLGMTDEVLRLETSAFRDHWQASAGRNAAKLDWEAAWRNWMREAYRRRGNGRGPPPQHKPSTLMQAGLDLIEEAKAKDDQAALNLNPHQRITQRN